MVGWQDIAAYYAALEENGTRYGFHPEPSRSILVVPEGSEEQATAFFASQSFSVVNGARYLGGFVGSSTSERSWLLNHIEH